MFLLKNAIFENLFEKTYPVATYLTTKNVMKRVYMVPHGLIFCVQKGIGRRIILLSVRGVKNALEK